MIIDTWDYRISDLLTAGKVFIEESGYPVNYNYENGTEYLWKIFNDPHSALIVHYIDDTFAGFAIVSREREAMDRDFGYITKLYVMPHARGTVTARSLMRECVEWFDATNCILSFATPTANIGADQAFINLLKKFDYEYTGVYLVRKQNEQSK